MIYRLAMKTPEGEELPAGSEVVLRERAYGYDAGTKGSVVRSNPETVLVRFAATGHTVPVARDLLTGSVRTEGDAEIALPAGS
jgi:hypothetical protein